jgi:hypothetical protein
MSTNVRNAEKSRKFLSGRVIKNSIYPVPIATVKISKRYSPRHLLLSEEIRLPKVQPVADQPSDVIRHPVRREERAEEIKVQ